MVNCYGKIICIEADLKTCCLWFNYNNYLQQGQGAIETCGTGRLAVHIVRALSDCIDRNDGGRISLHRFTDKLSRLDAGQQRDIQSHNSVESGSDLLVDMDAHSFDIILFADRRLRNEKIHETGTRKSLPILVQFIGRTAN